MSKDKRTISAQEIVQYRERLIKQKEFLTDILSKIEKQILALQVERLHLRNTLLGSECSNQEILPDIPIKDNSESTIGDHDPKDLTEQKLDLSVPSSMNNFEEEIEDDEITENEEQIINELGLII